MNQPHIPLYARFCTLLATLCTLSIPAVAGAQPCDLAQKALICDAVEVKGKLWVDGEETKVKCRSDAPGQVFLRPRSGDLQGLITLSDASESCQSLVAHGMLSVGEPDTGVIPVEGVGQPQRISKGGKLRNECLVQATLGPEARPGEDGPLIASLHGSWKFHPKTGQPKVLKAGFAAHYVPDATGISGRFIGTLKATECTLASQ